MRQDDIDELRKAADLVAKDLPEDKRAEWVDNYLKVMVGYFDRSEEICSNLSDEILMIYRSISPTSPFGNIEKAEEISKSLRAVSDLVLAELQKVRDPGVAAFYYESTLDSMENVMDAFLKLLQINPHRTTKVSS